MESSVDNIAKICNRLCKMWWITYLWEQSIRIIEPWPVVNITFCYSKVHWKSDLWNTENFFQCSAHLWWLRQPREIFSLSIVCLCRRTRTAPKHYFWFGIPFLVLLCHKHRRWRNSWNLFWPAIGSKTAKSMYWWVLFLCTYHKYNIRCDTLTYK